MFEIAIQIERPPADIFGALSRVEDAPRWYSAVTRVERLDTGPPRLGARARMFREVGGSKVENVVEFTAFSPDAKLTLSSVSGPTPFTYDYTLTPAGGGTLLTLRGKISGEGLPGLLGMLAPLAEPFFKRGMATNLKSLKTLIERG